MSIFPEYQDVTLVNKFVNGEFPFYILLNRIDTSIILHHHNFVELSLVIEGKGVEIVNGQIHSLQPGTITFLLPNHIHEIHSEPNYPILLYCCMFDLNLLFRNSQDHSLGNTLLKTGKELPSHYDLNASTFNTLKHLMEGIMEEYTVSHPYRDTLILAKLYEALILIQRFHSDNGTQGVIKPFKSNNPIWAIIQHIHSHYNEALTLTSVSRQLNWNPSYLSRTFSQQTGKTFINYLHALRIDRAASLLITTEMKVFDISLEVGFEHFRSFSRVFKEIHGITPSEYRLVHAVHA